MKVAHFGQPTRIPNLGGGPKPESDRPGVRSGKDEVILTSNPVRESRRPCGWVRAGKAVAYGAVTAVAIGLTSRVSPYLGAVVSSMAGGLAGLSLGVVGIGALMDGAARRGAATSGAHGALMVGLGAGIVGGAAGFLGGIAMPFLVSPEVAGAVLGAATMATQWKFGE